MINGRPATTLESLDLPVQAKLAAAWTSFMFLVIYVDYFHLYKPGVIDDLRAGIVWEFDVSQTLLTAFLTVIAIPSLMVVLSMALPARINRPANLVVAALYIPVSIFNVAGESWIAFYGVSIGLEVLIMGFVLRCAWAWPRTALVADEPGHRTAMMPLVSPSTRSRISSDPGK